MYTEYLNNVLKLLDNVAENQASLMLETAQVIADAIENNGLVHVVGCGHSQMFAQELFHRAGGSVAVNAILPSALCLAPYAPMSTWAERQCGLAEVALNGEKDIREGDVLIVVSTSGRNAVPIEFAMEGQKRGLKVIALTSTAFSGATSSRHPSGKKLAECADIVLDNPGEPGDATVQVPNSDFKTGSTSSVMGFAILNSIMGTANKLLVERGYEDLILASVNSTGAVNNDEVLAKRQNRLTLFN
ncbi:SIS domain-containing protein [Vibrio sp. Hep-1b-8]|uniref:sugar isomerase domain-containing protein n=1 Tax=Vibrio sp. Hep-1b-8 TaxID=2144187 RepID=UPI0011104832|nr:SIS domain-containing protein [Vibrio sp. Hep-1b-8]TMX44556.1 SIS domain-containing protein [Vibrio sp. Hep-1b-8]